MCKQNLQKITIYLLKKIDFSNGQDILNLFSIIIFLTVSIFSNNLQASIFFIFRNNKDFSNG